jgi:thiol-disulfide isomerase/thioredoxin
MAAPSFDALGAAERLKGDEKFGLAVGAGKGSYLPWAQVKGGDVKTVAEGGADVPSLEPHLAKGKVTVVDFSAIWCDPCRTLDEHMLKLVEARQDVAYRKLEIGDWDTPLAQRYLKTARQLPYVLVYDKGGRRIAEVSGLDLAAIEAAIQKAAQ